MEVGKSYLSEEDKKIIASITPQGAGEHLSGTWITWIELIEEYFQVKQIPYVLERNTFVIGNLRIYNSNLGDNPTQVWTIFNSTIEREFDYALMTKFRLENERYIADAYLIEKSKLKNALEVKKESSTADRFAYSKEMLDISEKTQKFLIDLEDDVLANHLKEIMNA